MAIDSDLTPEQRQVLNQVREGVSDLLLPDHDDEYILRFVIARKYDVDSSVQMLKRHLLYWKKHNLDMILRNYTIEKKTSYFLTTPLGFDKEGSLVRLLRVGQTDLKGLVMSHTPQEAVQIASFLLYEDIKSQKQRRETHGDGSDGKMSYIIDLQGLPWGCLVSRPLITYFLILLRAYESNFPEYLKMAYIINAPSFFNLILNFAKNVLPNDVCSKIVVLSGDPKMQLTSVIDESILPAFLGGTLTSPDNDPTCPHLFLVTPGTPVPEEYYLAANVTGLSGDPEAKKTIVLNQSSFSIELEIKEPNSAIIWDFETVDNDIGMGLRFKQDGEQEYKDVIPVRRVNSHRYTESGRYDCKECGMYEILFDNAYSWWAKKELMYKVSVESKNMSSDEIS